MPDLNQYAQAAVLTYEGQVLSVNELAQHYIPQLEVGEVVPEWLDLPIKQKQATGTFVVQGTVFEVRCTQQKQGQLYLFAPTTGGGISNGQMDHALAQMRKIMGEFLTEIGPYTANESGPLSQQDKGEFSRSYHRMMRLIENLDYVNAQAQKEAPDYHPITINFNALCRQVVEEAASVLQESGTEIEYKDANAMLLLFGDPVLLKRMLLGLISNSAKGAKEGRIWISLQRRKGRLILRVTDNGTINDSRRRMAMVQQDTPGALPLPDSGAGLGMSVIRSIVHRHQGVLMVEWGKETTSVVISFPIGSGSPMLSVQTPRMDRTGGLFPLMVELSDVLPAHLYSMEGLN